MVLDAKKTLFCWEITVNTPISGWYPPTNRDIDKPQFEGIIFRFRKTMVAFQLDFLLIAG